MKKVLRNLALPIIGLASLIWFLVRVIPKPSRAAYPCIRATMPIASSFVLYVLGLFSSVVFFKKARKFFIESRYVLFSITLILSLFLGISSYLQTSKKVYANYRSVIEDPNQPMGEGKGIFPGRVVWVHNPDATREACQNRRNDYWYDDSNTDQAVVDKMVSEALYMLTGTNTDEDAWNAIFHYYNSHHDRGDVGYSPGEKIVIKINFNAVSNGPSNINTSPQICYTVLNQLINVVGVAQSDISIGDPNINFDTPHWTKCHGAFPDVNYWGYGNGRTPVQSSDNFVLFSSDGTVRDWLPQCYLDAAYMINMPVFKKHHRGGISITSKNHFGSITPFNGSAFHWHFSLPAPDGGADVSNGEYGVYRCFVDIMGHKDLGGKTILFLVDGLWSSINWGHPPIKWRMAPFNNDWPSSVFASQDPVAIQSVCFDFLFNEFDENHPTEGAYDPRDDHGPFPHYAGVDDFLHQAADSKNWPENFVYDPENDGTPLPASLGVHEHWNNATEMKYSRNLGANEGIELVSNYNYTGVVNHNSETTGIMKDFVLYQNHPNPFNPNTNIKFELATPSHVNLSIFNITGQHIRTVIDEYENAGLHIQNWDAVMDNGMSAPSGIYVYRLSVRNKDRAFEQTKKMVLSR